jgi:hypothetical protein
LGANCAVVNASVFTHSPSGILNFAFMILDSTHLLASLRSETAPVTFAKLKKAHVNKKTGVSEADFRSALDSAVSSSDIFVWAKNRYWHIDPEAQLQSEILNQCATQARKKTEIKVKGRTQKDVAAAIDRLLAARKLLRYPALAGSSVLFVAVGSPQAYWTYVQAFVAEKLKKAGIAEASLEESIWDHLVKLEPDNDAPVSAARIRKATAIADKRRFDEAVLKLRDERRIHLSPHDDPQSLSAQDREELIQGKDGSYYVAITRR